MTRRYYDGCHLYNLEDALNAASRERSGPKLTADQRYWQRHDPPTVEDLRRHASRYGPAGVAETAAAFGLDLRARTTKARGPQPKRQRRTSLTLRQQVIDLHARGLVRAAIADQLNVADRRVAAILGELKAEAA